MNRPPLQPPGPSPFEARVPRAPQGDGDRAAAVSDQRLSPAYRNTA